LTPPAEYDGLICAAAAMQAVAPILWQLVDNFRIHDTMPENSQFVNRNAISS